MIEVACAPTMRRALKRSGCLLVVALSGLGLTSAGRAPLNAAATIGVRNGHALAYDSDRGRVLLFGGADESRVLADLWEWDGKSWLSLSPNIGLPPRTFAAVSYDRERQRLVVLGGNRVLFGKPGDGDTFLQDMWEWYGGSWHQASVPTPPSRAEATMVYDSARRRLVLFGGYRGVGPNRVRLGDTWEFDGSRWKELHPNRSPSPRNGAGMAYDVDRRRVVLFGGSGGPNADTWEWDGSSWDRVTAPTPARFNPAMAYDTVSRMILRFGGWNGQAREADTWFYDGQRWKPVDGVGPEPRNHASLAYDEKREVFVLFGGHDGELVFGDTWEWHTGSWSRIAGEKPRRRIDNGH